MNKYYLILLLFSPLFGFNQSAIEVVETVESIENVSGNALQTNIFRSNEKDIYKGFKSLLKGYGGSVTQKRDFLLGTEVMINSISDHEIKVYAKLKEVDQKTASLFVIFLKGDTPVSSRSDVSSYTAAKEILLDFSRTHSQKAVDSYYKSEEKKLQSLEKELEYLIKAKQKAEKEIDDCKKSITENEYNIKENIEIQKTINDQIEKQKNTVKSARDEKELF